MALGRFKRAYPAVRIEASVDRNTTLTDRLDKGELDLALIFGRGARSDAELVAKLPVFLDWGQESESHFGAGRRSAVGAFRIPMFLP
jgi:hypothetical protein